MKHTLEIDLETFSSAPLVKTGSWKYFESPDFEILLFGYSLDGQPVECLDLASGDVIPDWLEEALYSDDYIKYAYNAHFEIGALSRHYGRPMVANQWRCVMFHGLYAGYTAGLEATGAAVGLPADKQKLKIGKDLIRLFSVPRKPTKKNPATRIYPADEPEKWELYKDYNRQDVVTEMEIERRLSAFPVPDWVQHQWEVDLDIARRGVAVDVDLVEGALYLDDVSRRNLMKEAEEITSLSNPNSVAQLSAWLNEAMDLEGEESISSLTKATVEDLLGRQGNSEDVQRMLEIRKELAKTSTKKYNAIASCVCSDNRVRGLLQFYGANRTGRWAGRLVQVQNLPRTYTQAIEVARDLVKKKSLTGIKLLYGSVPDTLSQLIRTAFIAAPGNVLIDADFSAIEARVISWLAGEEWRLDVFRTHGKIYEASASQMFGVPIEKIKKGNPEYALRAKGKVAELALGFQGGPPALVKMGALNMGLTEEELPDIVQRWRDANSKIRDLWYAVDSAAQDVINLGVTRCVKYLTFAMEYDPSSGRKVMSILLPSGRKLYYVDAHIGVNRFGNPSIIYRGVNQTTKKWQDIETYGGKLVENCVQAIARDALASVLDRLDAAGIPVVFHVHDEVVIDVKPWADKQTMLNTVYSIMKEPIPWAKDLPLNADGWVGDFFTKD